MLEDPALAPLVSLVEEGATLADSQLDQLRRAVESRPDSADWLLCLGHALVNSERSQEALPFFDRAATARPDAVLVYVGRARCLGALERYSEAGAELRQALKRFPRHADALRALALLRLRAGALAEAVELCERVLEVDPIDEETKLILAEAKAGLANAGLPSAQSPGTLEDFARDLQRSLAERGLKSAIDPAAGMLVIELTADRQGRMALAGLWDACKADARGRAAYIEGFVGSLARMQAPERVPPLEKVRERVFPVLRTERFLERSGPALRAPASAGLLWLYALDHPDFVSYLPPECASAWGISPEELARIALANLERAVRPPARYRIRPTGLEPAPTGRWHLVAFDAGDGYDASRLCSPAHLKLLEAIDPGGWVAALPTVSYALLAREQDRDAIAFLRVLAQQEGSGDQGLSTSLYRLTKGGLEPLV